MTRFLGFVVALLLTMVLVAPLAAQDATPVPSPPLLTAPALGLSEFDIIITDEGFDLPSAIPAGRYLVNVTNNSSEEATAAAFIKPPSDWTLQQVQEMMTAAGAEEATPADFAWLFEIPIAGGAGGAPGTTGQAVIDLDPGRWVVWGDDPSSPLPLAEVNVTGAMPDTLRDVVAEVTITAISTATGYDFAIEGTIVAGPQLIKFVNKTDQPHFVSSLMSPVPLDDEMFMALFMMEEGATPEPDSGLPAGEDIIDNPSSISTISSGTTVWAVMDFAAGFHTVLCFVPDINSPEGLPHAAEGMIEHIEVK